MKYVSFRPAADSAAAPRAGALSADGTAVLPLDGLCRGGDLLDLIGREAEAAEMAAAAAPLPLDEVVLLAPLPRPGRNLFCVGKNYHAHAEEFHRSGFDASAGKDATPEFPIIFTKAPSTVTGPGAPIPSWLDYSDSTDYEGELAVVIGKGGRGIAKAAAMDHVWGYTVANDVTARNLQKDHRQWLIGKSIDGFCPMGPCITPAADIPELGEMRLTTHVNGEKRQDAVLKDLIFDIPTLIETISRVITLEPGDIILTGTPEGVGIGMAPPVYLVPGDTVRVEISGIGALENPVA
ncbi:fumarylacetoacetate hydrolase family protein [Poseidonocella sp. HB161398]|uniref:fumarylacetoacetate hydrolase family protein n=1 Tax=Poseidonocella sp. HB161398 TaxID=2320855 RepID=UPI0011094C73|nr:fumarylacetoacetate hydrolase family protein [Poseidonocella sp. HB161398]